MIRIVVFIILSICLIPDLKAQAEQINWKYPVEQGRILYHYTGNTSGYRELFFRDFGSEQALYTNLERSSTFFSITTTTPENVVEFLKEGKHHHFDLDSKKGLTLDFPIHLLHKYFRIPDTQSPSEGLLEIGAERMGEEDVNGYLCEKWTYRDRDFWVWQGLLLKMNSSGLNKNFSMEAVEIDFKDKVPDKKFNFPKKIQIMD
jgi:hypothetical protein